MDCEGKMEGGIIGWNLITWSRLMKVISDVPVSRNWYKTCQIYTKIQIYAAKLSPMRVQYTGHVSLSVSRDQYTALPLVEVLLTS